MQGEHPQHECSLFPSFFHRACPLLILSRYRVLLMEGGVMLPPRATETVLLPKLHTALVLPSLRTAGSAPIRTSVFSESA